MSEEKKPTFTIQKQKIERLILTGPVAALDEAIAYAVKGHYVLARVGPRLLGKAGHGIDERRFVLLGERELH